VSAGAVARDLGYQCVHADLNRFAARFRVARSFRGLNLHDYGQDTVAGYGGLLRVFLTWSAFEQYLSILPMHQADCGTLLKPHISDEVIDTIRESDDDQRFFTMIAKKTNPKNRDQINRYLASRSFNFSYLASAIRHVFAHGDLTPHAEGADPWGVRRLCDEIAEVHLKAAGTDFAARVKRLKSKAR